MVQEKLKPIDFTIGELMTIEDFIGCVNAGGFIDYDGVGQYADPIVGIMVDDPDNYVKPSHVKKGLINKKWTHVIWYNR